MDKNIEFLIIKSVSTFDSECEEVETIDKIPEYVNKSQNLNYD